MTEKVYQFGKDGVLVGIMTSPDAPTSNDNLPGVLLLNAGLVHRVGPFRLYVDLARKLAAQGFTVFRFDLSGVGDSEMRKGSRPYEERVVDEAREAMDVLSEHKGVREYVLMGICSGARLAHRVAVADPRVSGIVLLDGYGYRTLGYYLRYYCKRALGLSNWIDFIKRKFVGAIKRVREERHETIQMDGLDDNVFPPKEQVRSDLTMLVDRGVNLLFIYSGGVEDYYYYQDQFKDAFSSVDFQGRLQVEFFKDATHTFTLLKDRAELFATLCRWVQARYQYDPDKQDAARTAN